jgi:hypothetical protein
MPETEARARRELTVGLVIAAVVLLTMIALLVVLAVDARQSASQSVISILRDAAIVLVAFETLVIGVLLIILMLQMRSLVVLIRDEIQPMLESVNDTMATMRGTTRFMSEKVVSPTIKAAGFWAGVRRVVKEIADLAGLGR